ncbi:MAG: type II secretion system F family protein [Armatimonadetes bacterium]|nr:type II secretion system F family protein [Armatimonadota bacterium]MDW8027965.1 type II secretion system F family protein [Armatimonadota bacterium]
MKSASGAISRIELAIFCRQFSAMLSAGVDAFRAVEVLRQQTDNPRLMEVLEGISRDLSMGKSLAHAFSRYPNYFSPLFISMIRQGEREGILNEVLLKLAEHLEREATAFGFSSETATVTRFDWDAFVEKLRPLVTWMAIVVGIIMVMVASLWYVTLIGFLPRPYLGPNIVLLIGLMMLLFALVFLRYKPPQLLRCNFCGRPESVAGTLIPGEGVHICADCVQRSVQILREHQLAVADQPVEVAAGVGDDEETKESESKEFPEDEKLWRPRGQVVYLSDEETPEEERIKILPKPEDEQ